MSTANHTDRRVVTVTVPATSANLGPGFDCLGLALELRNTLTLTASEFVLYEERETTYTVSITGVDATKVPADRTNLALEAAEVIFRLTGRRPATAELRVHNCIPVGSGLGSSSSAIVGGLVAANALVGGGLNDEELLRLAVTIEGHPDNVAPALLGGLVLGVLPDAGGPEKLVVRRMAPPHLTAVVVMPDFHFLTVEARAVLPRQVTRADAIYNTSRLGLLLHALLTSDFSCLRVAMGDRLHQTQRLGIIPGAAAAFDAAYGAGALGVALSGAGPSLIAFTDGDGGPIAAAMLDAFAAAGQSGRSWLLQPTADGVTLAVSYQGIEDE